MIHLFRRFAVLSGVLLLLQVPAIQAQTAPEKIREAVTQYELESAESLLRAAAKRSDKEFAANNYDYLLARILARRGNFDEARRYFDQVAARQSILGGYALWHGSELSRRAGDPASEQQRLSRLLREYPSFLHRRSVIERLGASYLASRKYRGSYRSHADRGYARLDRARPCANRLLISNPVQPRLRGKPSNHFSAPEQAMTFR
jgi:tetratricopeptide (TPR) repeat protein